MNSSQACTPLSNTEKRNFWERSVQTSHVQIGKERQSEWYRFFFFCWFYHTHHDDLIIVSYNTHCLTFYVEVKGTGRKRTTLSPWKTVRMCYTSQAAPSCTLCWQLLTMAHSLASASFKKDESSGTVNISQHCRSAESEKPPPLPCKEKILIYHIQSNESGCSYKDKAWLMVTGRLWPCIRAQLDRRNV